MDGGKSCLQQRTKFQSRHEVERALAEEVENVGQFNYKWKCARERFRRSVEVQIKGKKTEQCEEEDRADWKSRGAPQNDQA